MTRIPIALLTTGLLFFVETFAQTSNVRRPDASGAPVADMILQGGSIYTSDPATPLTKAVAVRDGKVVYVGSAADAVKWKGTNTEVMDLKGRMLLPGFIDGHNHVSDHPEALFWLNTRMAATVQEVGQMLIGDRAKNSAMKQLRAIGWEPRFVAQAAASSGKSPAQLLDQYVADIPVVVLHNAHHDMWVNSLGLKNAGIDENTSDPEGAVFERIPGTPGHGSPSGILHEFGAMYMVEQALPDPDFTVAQFRQAILDWQRLAAERGVTSVLVPQPRPSLNFYKALQQLDKEAKLTVRYDVAIWAYEKRGAEQVPEMAAIRDNYKGKLFRIDTAKIFGTDNASTLIWNQPVLNETVNALDKAGFRVFVHDIGNAASYSAVLDAFEYNLNHGGRRFARHTITHVGNGAVSLAARFKALDVRADGHPVPKAFFDVGAAVSISSDYPVREFFPMTRLAAAVSSGVPLERALTAHTLNGAELIFAETETGSIAVGKAADLVVMDRDLTGLAASEVSAARPTLTIFAGKVVYRKPMASSNAP
jgi:predicted amidohydrolase YtcJ